MPYLEKISQRGLEMRLSPRPSNTTGIIVGIDPNRIEEEWRRCQVKQNRYIYSEHAVMRQWLSFDLERTSDYPLRCSRP